MGRVESLRNRARARPRRPPGAPPPAPQATVDHRRMLDAIADLMVEAQLADAVNVSEEGPHEQEAP